MSRSIGKNMRIGIHRSIQTYIIFSISLHFGMSMYSIRTQITTNMNMTIC